MARRRTAAADVGAPMNDKRARKDMTDLYINIEISIRNVLQALLSSEVVYFNAEIKQHYSLQDILSSIGIMFQR